jgi:biopolymer transport protein ExbB
MMGESLWLGWWGEADWVVRGVFVLLIGLSVTSWSVILYKAVQLGRVLRLESRAIGPIEAMPVAAAREELVAGSPSCQVLGELLRAGQRGPATREALHDLVSHRVRAQRTELENGLVVLATTGNTAPFIGLLGTVWGIMHALQALGGAGGAISMDLIAGPVAEALVATAAGLFTAIPAVVGYNLLLRRLRRIMGLLEGNALRMLEAVGQEGSEPREVSAVRLRVGRAG